MNLKALIVAGALALAPVAAFAGEAMMDCCKDCACCKDKDKAPGDQAPTQQGSQQHSH